MNSVRVLGAATSADTHHAGQERAPDALLTGGFVDRLAAAALEGTGLGNVVHETFRADRTGDPAGCAEGARRAVEAASRLVVHFDVDAVDSGDLPLANFPHCGTGVPLAATRSSRSCSPLPGCPPLCSPRSTPVTTRTATRWTATSTRSAERLSPAWAG